MPIHPYNGLERLQAICGSTTNIWGDKVLQKELEIGNKVEEPKKIHIEIVGKDLF